MRAAASLIAERLHRRAITTGTFARHFHWRDQRHCCAGKFRKRVETIGRTCRSCQALHRSSLLLRSRVAELYQSLHPSRSGNDRHDREGRRAYAAVAGSRSESADLFPACRNRNPERPRKLGTLRCPHLQTPADAFPREILCLRFHTTSTKVLHERAAHYHYI